MTRGIHLKQLKKGDLLALGLPESTPEHLETVEAPWLDYPTPKQQRASKLARELRTELEGVMALLEEALEEMDDSPGEAGFQTPRKCKSKASCA